jgi:hypothetical protein
LFSALSVVGVPISPTQSSSKFCAPLESFLDRAMSKQEQALHAQVKNLAGSYKELTRTYKVPAKDTCINQAIYCQGYCKYPATFCGTFSRVLQVTSKKLTSDEYFCDSRIQDVLQVSCKVTYKHLISIIQDSCKNRNKCTCDRPTLTHGHRLGLARFSVARSYNIIHC